MNSTMQALDWVIVAGCVALLTAFSLRTVRYMRGVADFLAANRSAGRYMLTLAGGMSGFGAISAVAVFEQYYAAGFPTIWWSWLSIPASVVVALTGWVYYRFRETRCLTLAQFFEVRYSRRFRIFAALVVWISGIANFGIFPYVASNFFVYFCGLPETIALGAITIKTYIPIVILTTGMALAYTAIGGQITVMITDCVQGMFAGVVFLVFCLYLLSRFAWPDIMIAVQEAPVIAVQEEAAAAAEQNLEDAEKVLEHARSTAAGLGAAEGAAALAKAGEKAAELKKVAAEKRLLANDRSAQEEEASQRSMINPYKTSKVDSFSLWFFLILVFNIFYGAMSWQGSQAYQSSGISPHESKMGGIIALWRMLIQIVAIVLLAVCALTWLTQPQFAGEAAVANETLAALQAGDTPQLAVQQRVPIALTHMLPTGLRGLFCVLMMFLLVTTQDTYLHSWGSIFVQDVVLPLRKKAFTPARHVWALRWSIAFVALFSLVFATFYKPNEFIQMYFAITGAIISGLGPVIIGGLYWKRGGSLAAWVTVALGAGASLAFLFIRQLADVLKARFGPGGISDAIDYINGVNSQYQWFFIMMACVVSYVLFSLIRLRKPFDMDRLLHRGAYDTKGDHVKAEDASTSIWVKIFAITEEFSFTDRILAIALVVWNFGWLAVFVVATIYNYTVSQLTDDWWSGFWRFWIWMQIAIGIPATIWFTCGGIMDLKRVFHRLATIQRDDRDDGRVVDHHLPSDDPEERSPEI